MYLNDLSKFYTIYKFIQEPLAGVNWSASNNFGHKFRSPDINKYLHLYNIDKHTTLHNGCVVYRVEKH